VVGAQQACQTQHGLTDHRQVLGGFNGGYALTGQNFFCKSSNQDTQQGYFIPKNNPIGGLQSPSFGKWKFFGVEAVLGQRLMALGTALVCLEGTQLVAAALSFYRPFGWNNIIWL